MAKAGRDTGHVRYTEKFMWPTRYRKRSPDLGYLGRQTGQPHLNQASTMSMGANKGAVQER